MIKLGVNVVKVAGVEPAVLYLFVLLFLNLMIEL